MQVWARLICLQPVLKAIEQHVPHTAERLVDLGSGYGLVSALTALRRKTTVLGIEASPSRLLIARQATTGHIPNVSFQQGDIAQISLPPSDAILLIDVLCLFADDTQAHVLENCGGFTVSGRCSAHQRQYNDPAVEIPIHKSGRKNQALLGNLWIQSPDATKLSYSRGMEASYCERKPENRRGMFHQIYCPLSRRNLFLSEIVPTLLRLPREISLRTPEFAEHMNHHSGRNSRESPTHDPF